MRIVQETSGPAAATLSATPQTDRPPFRVCRAPWSRRANVGAITRAAIALLLLLRGVVSAQDVTEPALKAAFIYNFALFTEWPAGIMTPAGPFVVCVIGDAAVGDALERSLKGRVLGGRSLTVSLVPAEGPRAGCQVLYVSGVKPPRAAELLVGLRDVPVLTIGDVDGFTNLGGIAQFFFEHGQLRFTVEVASAKRARLQISSKLLALAKAR